MMPPKVDAAMSMSNSNLSDSPDKRSENGLVPKHKEKEKEPKRDSTSVKPNEESEAPKAVQDLDNSGLAFGGGFKPV